VGGDEKRKVNKKEGVICKDHRASKLIQLIGINISGKQLCSAYGISYFNKS